MFFPRRRQRSAHGAGVRMKISCAIATMDLRRDEKKCSVNRVNFVFIPGGTREQSASNKFQAVYG